MGERRAGKGVLCVCLALPGNGDDENGVCVTRSSARCGDVYMLRKSERGVDEEDDGDA